jgi:hypothetical protein
MRQRSISSCFSPLPIGLYSTMWFAQMFVQEAFLVQRATHSAPRAEFWPNATFDHGLTFHKIRTKFHEFFQIKINDGKNFILN